jgi:Lrp/AsnC family transcriptional regulator
MHGPAVVGGGHERIEGVTFAQPVKVKILLHSIACGQRQWPIHAGCFDSSGGYVGADQVELSAAPCWRRIKKLEEEGIIVRRVALIDRRKANVPMTVFVAVRAPRHASEWLDAFRKLIASVPEIVEAWRLTGDTDYLLRIIVPNIDAYDAVYQRMIARLEFSDVNFSIAMEENKIHDSHPNQLSRLVTD